MPDKEKDIIYNQEEISDMIGNSPGWLLRSGIGMIALATLMIFAACAFIKYPDKFQGRGSLTSANPPVEIVSNASGYLQNILVEDQEVIKAGQELFYVENTGSKEDVVKLENWFDQFDKASTLNEYANLNIPKGLQLGAVQDDYAAITLKFNEFKQAIQNGIVSQEKANLTQEIENIERLKLSQRKEKEIFKKELDLFKKSITRAEELYKNGLSSLDDVEKLKTELLQKERAYEGMENAIIKNDIKIEQLELQKIRLGRDRNDLTANYKLKIAELISTTKSKIQNWSEQYIIKAKLGGEIVFKTELNENKFINENEILATIIPKEKSGNFLSIKAPIANIGKIEVGQRVIIKFDAYPYKEFGIVESKVSSIGKIPEQLPDGLSYYEVKTQLADKITSDYNKTIPFKPGMTATVDIITEDKTIARRVLNQFFALSK